MSLRGWLRLIVTVWEGHSAATLAWNRRLRTTQQRDWKVWISVTITDFRRRLIYSAEMSCEYVMEQIGTWSMIFICRLAMGQTQPELRAVAQRRLLTMML